MGVYKVRILTPEQADAKYATKGELAAVVGGEDGGGGVAVWGSIIGVLADQPDLLAALQAKQYKLEEGAHIIIDETDPLHPVISATGVQAQLIAGDGIDIDITDPANPVISSSGGGGAGLGVFGGGSHKFFWSNDQLGAVDWGWEDEYIMAFPWTPTETGTVAMYPGHDFSDPQADQSLTLSIVVGDFLNDDNIPIPTPVQGADVYNAYYIQPNPVVEWETSDHTFDRGEPTMLRDENAPYDDPQPYVFQAGQKYTVIIESDIGYEGPGPWWFSMGSIKHSLNQLGGFDPEELSDMPPMIPQRIAYRPDGPIPVPLTNPGFEGSMPGSVVFGPTSAKGGGISVGTGSADGQYGVAFQGRAYGDYSTAVAGDAFGERSIAVTGGLGQADGYCALSIGYSAVSQGNGAVAVGGFIRTEGTPATARGDYSTAVGSQAVAYWLGSAVGNGSTAMAKRAFSLGSQAKAQAPYSGVIGSGQVIRREKTLLSAVNLEITRSTEAQTQDTASGAAIYSGSATGVILSDSAGAKWRITVSTGGVVSAAAYTEPAMPFTNRTTSSTYGWTGFEMSTTGTYVLGLNSYGYIYTSANAGVSWTQRTGPGSRSWYDGAVSADGTKMVATTNSPVMWFSINNGVSWTSRTMPDGLAGYRIAASSDLGVIHAFFTSYGQTHVVRTTDMGVTWSTPVLVPVGDVPYVNDIACSSDGTIVYIMADAGYWNGPGTQKTDIWKSTNSGDTWTKINTIDYIYQGRMVCSYSGADIHIMSYLGSMYVSRNSGTTFTQYPIWTQTEPNLANSVFSGFPANAISSSGLVGYAAAGKSGIYKTTDGGSTWHYIDQTAGGFNWSLLALSPDGTKLILPNDTSVIYTN